MKKRKVFICLIMVLVLVLAGCSSGTEKNTAADQPDDKKAPATVKEENLEPVTLNIALRAGQQANFEDYVANPVKKKFPNVSFKQISLNNGGNNFQQMLASGESPDLLMVFGKDLNALKDLGLMENLEPLIKKHNLDLNRFDPKIIDSVKALIDGGKLDAIPYLSKISALYYNKAIFNKFAVEYPKDGMTWEEARDLAVKLTRVDGGVQYMGLEPDVTYRNAYQYGASSIDAKTMKASVNTDKWKHVFEMMKSIYTIPGNETILWFKKGETAFLKDQTIAMVARKNMFAGLQEAKGSVDWDLVTFPAYKDAPGISLSFDLHAAVLASTSKHKDIAFQVIQTIVSDEVQTVVSKDGELPAINKKSIQAEFGKHFPVLEGKNVQAVFKTTPALPPHYTAYEDEAVQVINNAIRDVVAGSKDINTALRESDEAINKIIQNGK
jgi:multiple sugar transport system substrate-binding protein